MKLYYDLHMHSALSPCGDDDMTPNNIVHMAMLKELDLIAVTDHNSARNLPAVKAVADACNIALLPGIEITTAEEVHLLGYFPSVETAVEFGDMLYDALPPVKNRVDIFGNQNILDEDDEITGTLDKLLLNATPYSYDELCRKIREAGGVPVPAHVNRDAYSVMANLGMIPDDPLMKTIEVYEKLPANGFDQTKFRCLYSSDAHYLLNMAEKNHYLNCERDTESILSKLRSDI